jgi:hypothetical protein
MTSDQAQAGSTEITELEAARAAYLAASDRFAAASYQCLVSAVAERWPTAAAIRVVRDGDDWAADAIIDAEGNELAGRYDEGVSAAVGSPVSDIQEAGCGYHYVDDTGDDPLHDHSQGDAGEAGVIRFGIDPPG